MSDGGYAAAAARAAAADHAAALGCEADRMRRMGVSAPTPPFYAAPRIDPNPRDRQPIGRGPILSLVLAGILVAGLAVSSAVREADNRGTGVARGVGGSAVVVDAPSASASPVGSIANGLRVHILCTVRGDVVIDAAGLNVDLWDKVTPTGYVSDAWLDTGTNDPVAPPC